MIGRGIIGRGRLTLLGALAPAIALWGCGGLGGGADRGAGIGGAMCLAELSARNAEFRSVSGADPRDARCAVDTAVRVSRLDAAFDRPVVIGCALAERLARFEREALAPLAAADLGQGVVRLDQLGGFSCRAQSAGRTDRLSQHAFGNAIDIAGFRLADGATVSVERDWGVPGPAQVFLRHVAQSACRYFSVVLTPDSNLEHYNHFHFDIGPGRLCSGA